MDAVNVDLKGLTEKFYPMCRCTSRRSTLRCHDCDTALIERDWYTLRAWRLTNDGQCPRCGTACAGVFDGSPGRWGAKRKSRAMGA